MYLLIQPLGDRFLDVVIIIIYIYEMSSLKVSSAKQKVCKKSRCFATEVCNLCMLGIISLYVVNFMLFF